jgi:hypothetical protein
MEGVRYESADALRVEGRKEDLMHPRIARPDRFQRLLKRMGRADLVFAVSTNQQEVPHLRVCHQVLNEVERRRIQPLQIVEE